jgi:hypothetical protein
MNPQDPNGAFREHPTLSLRKQKPGILPGLAPQWVFVQGWKTNRVHILLAI